MISRTYTTQSAHDKLVKALADKFETEGYFVKADHIEHPNGAPSEVNGYKPDIYATKTNQRIIVEAETCDSIGTDETHQQWQAFSVAVGMEFHVIVPKQCLATAQEQAKLWGVNVDKWWYLEI